jgi:signal transduction histidine kinase
MRVYNKAINPNLPWLQGRHKQLFFSDWIVKSHMEHLQHEEAQALAQTLSHQLINFAASLKGRLSTAEEDALAKLFQMQISLQSLLEEAKPLADNAVVVTAAPDSIRETDSIAYAQVMQYARDLVKAMRQKKEHQRRLELTSQQLIRAEKLATVGQVAATVAHELNNILTPLLMYAKLIYNETNKDSDVAGYATQITEIANRASNMLRQLVDASRNDSASTIPVDLARVIKNALALLAPRVQNQHIELKQQYPHNLLWVKGNPSQLEQVFINIALNAFDAMPKGGKFTISIQLGHATDQPDEADFVTIQLRDTGEGIAPEHLGNIFEPFFTTKARGAGAGLGLFVSYVIIDQHHGTIEVDSELGVGTTFIIKLPTLNSKDEN